MRHLLAILLSLLPALAMADDLVMTRQRNVATVITFSLIDGNDTPITGAAGLDSEIVDFNDANAPTTFADCTNEATEIGSTGIYSLSLTAAELNFERSVVRIQSSTTDVQDRVIHLDLPVGDPLLAATTDDGGAINVASGGVELSSAGLDSVSVTDPTGVPSNFREVVMWLGMRMGLNKVIKNGSTSIITYRDDGSTPATTNNLTVVTDTQTLGAAQ